MNEMSKSQRNGNECNEIKYSCLILLKKSNLV